MDHDHVGVVDLPVAGALERVIAELAKEGSGVLTSTDVKATLKQQIDRDGQLDLAPAARVGTVPLRAAVHRV